MAQAFLALRPSNPKNPINRLIVALTAYGYNWWFFDRIRDRLDFVGVNYYCASILTWYGALRNPLEPVNDLGYYLEPSAIEEVLVAAAARYHKPVIITENGTADEADGHRRWWLEETIAAMQRALARGVDLRGYLHWSLLDNFEWSFGWWPKFGLIAVDRSTMMRSIKPSARWFAEYLRRIQSLPRIPRARSHRKA